MAVGISSIFFKATTGAGLDSALKDSTDSLPDSLSALKKFVEITGAKDILKEVSSERVLDIAEREIETEKTKKINRFSQGHPIILFTSDYVIEGENIGALIVFERYFDATHYEVFKQNKFDNEPKFERILFLDAVSLEEETKRFLPFVKDIVGFDLDQNSVFIILDDSIKKDRIYEYFVRAVFVPKDIEDVVYSVIMQNKEMIKVVEPTPEHTIHSFAVSVFGKEERTWIFSLLNPKLPFFGKITSEIRVSDIQKSVLVPKKVEELVDIIKDAIYLFGAKTTFSHLILNLGAVLSGKVKKKSGFLNQDMSEVFIESLDENKGLFSFDHFKQKVSETFSDFKSVPAGSLPPDTGNVSFNDLAGITKILWFVKRIDLVVTHAQEDAKEQQQTAPLDVIFDAVIKPKTNA